jgi:hypothetical protein
MACGAFSEGAKKRLAEFQGMLDQEHERRADERSADRIPVIDMAASLADSAVSKDKFVAFSDTLDAIVSTSPDWTQVFVKVCVVLSQEALSDENRPSRVAGGHDGTYSVSQENQNANEERPAPFFNPRSQTNTLQD